MDIRFFPNKDIDGFDNQLTRFENNKNIKGILILACENNNFTPEKINPSLKKLTKPVFGGIFPLIIHQDKKYETGYIIAGFYTKIEASTINLTKSESIEDNILDISSKYLEAKTLFIFIDGLSNQINNFIESIFSIFGLEFNFIGGGAGSLSLKQQSCIITNDGLIQDCAIIAGVTMESGIGVKHGWNSVAGPFRITSAEKTEIKEIDFQPAFDVYQNLVNKYSTNKINKDNFFEIAKAFPFGINKIDTEKIIRDPIRIGSSNSLICVGEVKNGDFVDILSGQKKSLIESSGEALRQALKNKENIPENFILFIDCISRVLFLQDDFYKELEEVNKNSFQLPVIGALTLGEIANNGKEYLEFYNKTAVIGCF